MSAPPLVAGSEVPRAGERAAAWTLAVASALLVAAVVRSHAAGGGMPFDARPLLAFDASKLPAFLRSLGVLAAINLAAWAAGGLLQRLLTRSPAHSLLDAVRRLALGFLVLADLVLLLAALHLLHRGIVLVALLWLAATGLVQITLAVRAARPRIGIGRDAATIMAAAAVALVAANVVLGAHMPDYGWDAFTYHLALPERYLFENRVVVAPLFPHTAMPMTIEMLYALVLAVDPGPAAKLLHAELGGLAAAAVAALGARHSRRAAALALVVLAADPLFNWELGVAYSDLGATLFTVLAVASLQDWLAERRPAALRLCGVLAGACIATRYTAVAVLVAVLALLWAARDPVRLKLRHSAIVTALAAAVVSPWVVRNLAITGNPAAPALQSLFYAPGEEYFDAQAMRQQLAFVRQVGFGRGLGDLLALPVNLTVRAREGDYRAFGFRVGPLYAVGLAAALVLRAARGSPALRAVLPTVGAMTLAWFFTAQEPRYLMPALGLAALASAVGLAELLRLCAAAAPRAVALLPWVVPAAALVHTQAATLARVPYVYGYALGRLSVAGFRSQDPALMMADRLRGTLSAGDRLLLVYEPRGFFFQGMPYVFAHYFELMQLIHRAGDPETLAAELRGRGVTHVLVHTGNIARYRTVAVPGYGEEELDGDLQVLGALLQRHSTLVAADRGVFVRRMDWAGSAPDKAGPGTGGREWER